MSGDHAKIEKWRVEESVNITKELRPDLYEKYESVQEKVDRHKELSKSIRKMQHHISVSMKEVQK
jgi:tRNA (guanine37-N1)-methyltransferase